MAKKPKERHAPYNEATKKILLAKAPKVEELVLADIEIPNFQRYLKEDRVISLTWQFDPHKVRRPLVNRRTNGTLIAVDGQHTIETLKALGFDRWTCDVTDMTTVDEIVRYADQHDQIRTVSNLDRLYALSLAILEPGGASNDRVVRADAILKAVKEAGWTFERGKTGKPDCSVQMTVHTSTGLEEVFDLAEERKVGSGASAIKQVLEFLEYAWPKSNIATEPNIIRAFGMIFRNYDLTKEQRAKVANNPIRTIAEQGARRGGQQDKRNLIANYIRWDILGLTARGEFRNR